MNHPFFKLSLYIVALAIMEFGTRSSSYTASDVEGWKTWDWIQFWAGIAGSVALFVRGFIDKSWGDHVEEQKQRGNTQFVTKPTP